MDGKKPWNCRVFESIADAFDQLMAGKKKGHKGICASAAVMMYLTASDDKRQRYINAVRLAEFQVSNETAFDAAKKILSRPFVEGHDDPDKQAQEDDDAAAREAQGVPRKSRRKA